MDNDNFDIGIEEVLNSHEFEYQFLRNGDLMIHPKFTKLSFGLRKLFLFIGLSICLLFTFMMSSWIFIIPATFYTLLELSNLFERKSNLNADNFWILQILFVLSTRFFLIQNLSR